MKSTIYKNIHFLFIICTFFAFGQSEDNAYRNPIIITPELLLGVTSASNKNFTDRKMQKQVIINFGRDQRYQQQEWLHRLKVQRTGISLGYADLGNKNELGSAISVLSFLEFNPIKKKSLKIYLGIGASYFSKKYDSIFNTKNKAVSTDITWAFRVFTYYKLFSSKPLDWNIGLGYFHNSNGHSQLPNQGLNSFLIGVSTDIYKNYGSKNVSTEPSEETLLKSKDNYFALSIGYGINVLSIAFNSKKPVYSFSGEYGKIYNNIFKIGIGFYIRYYQHYYDYINDNESLVQNGREFANLKNHAVWNASNIGLTLNGEVLLNHIGIDMQVGFNLHKPGYKIDWRINQGWEYVPRIIPENSNIVLGKFDFYYRLKKLVSTRLGLKYYFIRTQKKTKSNLFCGAFINANLGQADFSELRIGYLHRFN